jgi:hypothetical protein
MDRIKAAFAAVQANYETTLEIALAELEQASAARQELETAEKEAREIASKAHKGRIKANKLCKKRALQKEGECRKAALKANVALNQATEKEQFALATVRDLMHGKLPRYEFHIIEPGQVGVCTKSGKAFNAYMTDRRTDTIYLFLFGFEGHCNVRLFSEWFNDDCTWVNLLSLAQAMRRAITAPSKVRRHEFDPWYCRPYRFPVAV